MTDIPISTRISEDLKELIDRIMAEEHLDRSSATRKLLHIGGSEYRRQRALDHIRAGTWTLGEAADFAGMDLWAFLDLLKAAEIPWVADDADADFASGLSA